MSRSYRKTYTISAFSLLLAYSACTVAIAQTVVIESNTGEPPQQVISVDENRNAAKEPRPVGEPVETQPANLTEVLDRFWSIMNELKESQEGNAGDISYAIEGIERIEKNIESMKLHISYLENEKVREQPNLTKLNSLDQHEFIDRTVKKLRRAQLEVKSYEIGNQRRDRVVQINFINGKLFVYADFTDGGNQGDDATAAIDFVYDAINDRSKYGWSTKSFDFFAHDADSFESFENGHLTIGRDQ